MGRIHPIMVDLLGQICQRWDSPAGEYCFCDENTKNKTINKRHTVMHILAFLFSNLLHEYVDLPKIQTFSKSFFRLLLFVCLYHKKKNQFGVNKNSNATVE